jgi:malate dehydrogenase (oxaloacetate-decarboxylating)
MALLMQKEVGFISVKKEVIKAVLPIEKTGGLIDALVDADVFICVSAAGVVTKEMVESMNIDPIVFALANPIPEIMPELAHSGGAKIVATGRSDLSNRANNIKAFLACD